MLGYRSVKNVSKNATKKEIEANQQGIKKSSGDDNVFFVGDLRVGGISDANKNARVTFLYFIHVF